jgi:hypothetical protein
VLGVGRLGFARSGLLFFTRKDTKKRDSTSNIQLNRIYHNSASSTSFGKDV